MGKRLLNTKITIGYLTNDLYTSYNYAIWKGINETCRKKKVNFLNFCGGELNSPDKNNQRSRNVIYELIHKEIIDGLILNSATLFHFVGREEIERFYAKFQDIPLVNIGIKTVNIPTVLVDNRTGVHDGMIHLIKDHGYKRIAFIKGPEGNAESELRYDTYKSTLALCGIKEDPALVESGNFFIESGARCLEKLREKNEKIDAVVAANDIMALGALNRAQQLGIVVPNELAIMGFDDIPDAMYSSIPLTTVRQPLFNQAQTAVELMLDLIANRKGPEDVLLPTSLVIRRSCGCFSKTTAAACMPEKIGRAGLTLGDLKRDYTLFVDQMNKTMTVEGNHHKHHWPEHLIQSFIEYVEGDQAVGSLSKLDLTFNQALIHDAVEIDNWQNSISALVKFTLPYLKNDYRALYKAESFWQQARILIHEMGIHSQLFSVLKSKIKQNTLNQISGELISNFNLNQLAKIITMELPRTGIVSCYLSLYEGRNPNSEYSILILAYNESGQEEIPAGGIRFKTKDLLPQNIKPAHGLDSYIVESLFCQEEQFGFILLKTDPQEGIFDLLRQQIGSALKSALLVQKVMEKEGELEELLKDQKERASELEYAYRALQENQEKMIIIEKMASLGRMTAGIAHEINTPLAAVRASLTELEALATEYKQSIGDAQITEADHKEIAEDMNKSIQISKKAAERVAQFIKSIKSQTRNLSPQDHCLFEAAPVIQDAILLLNYDLNRNNCSVNFNSINDDIKLYGSPGRLSQLITNLLTNAIDAYKGVNGGPITIKLMYGLGGVDLTVSDKGSGIKSEIISKIFDPMFSTKAFGEGTGLGLTIVHDIITGDFGGSIEAISKVNEGTSFILHFPKPREGINNGQKI